MIFSTRIASKLAAMMSRIMGLMTIVMLSILLWSPRAVWSQEPRPACPPLPEPPTQAQVNEAMAQRQDRGFLWEIRKGGLSSYLFGTIHVGQFSWTVPGPQVESAMRSSDVLAVEVDLSDPASIQGPAKKQSAAAASLPNHHPLMKRLRAQINAACIPDSVKQQLLQKGDPALKIATLTVLEARRVGLEPAYSIDMALIAWGRRLGKPVTSLETMESQLALLESTSQSDAKRALQEGLDGLEKRSAQGMIHRIARIWSDGALDELAIYPQWCDCMNTPEQKNTMKRLLDDRNLGMADKIDALHQQGQGVFAAVGSLHMVGPQSLPELMARRGYEVIRVEFPARSQGR